MPVPRKGELTALLMARKAGTLLQISVRLLSLINDVVRDQKFIIGAKKSDRAAQKAEKKAGGGDLVDVYLPGHAVIADIHKHRLTSLGEIFLGLGFFSGSASIWRVYVFGSLNHFEKQTFRAIIRHATRRICLSL